VKNKKLVLFVESLPTGKKNHFFESELDFLSNKFEEIIIIPLYYSEHIIKENNIIKVLKIDYFVPVNRAKVFSNNFVLIAKIFSYEFFKSRHRLKYCSELFKNLNVLLIHIGNTSNMKIKLNHYFKGDYLLYTYWFKQHTFSLLLLREMYKSPIKIISRVHGCDWDEERTDYFPFRYWQYSKIDKIIPISEYVKKYIVKNFKISPEKLYVSRLGVSQTDRISPIDSKQLHIVSCSGIIPLKRVAFIAEVIKKISIPVKWTHFGNGENKSDVEKIIESYDSIHQGVLMGHIPNSNYIDFMANNPVSFFMNWSISEGIPVSIMETISLGIPIIAPNVGGMTEIVNDITGFLISNTEISSSELALVIENINSKKDIYTVEKRKIIKKFAEENFSDEVNYTAFSNTIVNF